MNAMIREQFEWEGPVAVNESVLEERVKFIQTSVGEVKTELHELRAAQKALGDRFDKKTDDLATGTQSLRDRMDQRMNALDADNKALRDRLDQKTDALAAENNEIRKEMVQGFEKVNARLDEKTDALAREIAAQGKELRTEIGGLGKEMAGMRGTVKATFWITSVATSVLTLTGVIVGIGKALKWF
jgi:chromosome segregation ATPase